MHIGSGLNTVSSLYGQQKGNQMKTPASGEKITNIRHTIYVKLFWGIIIANELTYLLDYFFKTSLNDWVIPLAPDVLIIWMSIKTIIVFKLE